MWTLGEDRETRMIALQRGSRVDKDDRAPCDVKSDDMVHLLALLANVRLLHSACSYPLNSKVLREGPRCLCSLQLNSLEMVSATVGCTYSIRPLLSGPISIF